jgi:hypothetical protein
MVKFKNSKKRLGLSNSPRTAATSACVGRHPLTRPSRPPSCCLPSPHKRARVVFLVWPKIEYRWRVNIKVPICGLFQTVGCFLLPERTAQPQELPSLAKEGLAAASGCCRGGSIGAFQPTSLNPPINHPRHSLAAVASTLFRRGELFARTSGIVRPPNTPLHQFPLSQRVLSC